MRVVTSLYCAQFDLEPFGFGTHSWLVRAHDGSRAGMLFTSRAAAIRYLTQRYGAAVVNAANPLRTPR